MPIKDMVGFKSGRLTVIEFAGTNKNSNYRAMWLCQCECGNTKVIAGQSIRNGSSLSCGCLRLERATGDQVQAFENTSPEILKGQFEMMSRADVAKLYSVGETIAGKMKARIKKIFACNHQGSMVIAHSGRYSVTKRCSECNQTYTRWKEGVSTDDICDGFLGGGNVQQDGVRYKIRSRSAD